MPGQLPRKFFIVAFVPNANSPHNDGVEQWEARRRRVRPAHQQEHADSAATNKSPRRLALLKNATLWVDGHRV